nr:aminopeptidase [uncultured Enterobacter sp.]
MTVLAQLRDWLHANNLDAMLIASRQNKLAHMGIATGSGYVLVTREQAHILVDFRYYAEVAARTEGYRLHLLDKHNTLQSIVNQCLARENIATLGVEGEHVSWHTASLWMESLNARLVSAPLDDLRQIKSPQEVALIREACRIADATAAHIRAFIQPGMREREVAAELEWFMKQQGADKPAFDTIVASGERGALPHGKASEKVIVAGEFVTLDFGAQRLGYCSDMTRTLLVAGRHSAPEQTPLYGIYQTVLRAQRAAITMIKPGVPCHEIDAAARGIITDAGYGDYFGHNTGHAVGIDVHENPRFSPDDTTPLRPGMVLTVEPGIYLPGEGGVRIEEMVLVTETGAEVLYHYPTELQLTGEQ